MEHLPGLIADLALILITGAVTTLLFKRIRQPLVLGYIIAGFLVGPHLSLTPTVADTANIKILAEIGVIFLLFSLGLEFSFRKLKSVGGAASITAFVEIIFITVTGYLLGKTMGWSTIDSMFLGGMLASSSTTIIIKAFDELGLKAKRYVHIVFGVLIVEDIVVILLMVLLSTVAVTQQFQGTELLSTVPKLLFFMILWFLAGIFLIPTLLKSARKLLDGETLLILAIGLCLGMVVIATQVGFSAELGAFIMGSILAETTAAERVEHLIKPVKDMFGAVFFVSVGMLIDPQTIVAYRWPVLWVTLLVLFGKLFSTTAGALLSGQPLKQSVQVGMSMAQVGEFAFIVASLGLSLGVTSDFLFPVVVGVSAITTFTTPYMIRVSETLSRRLERILPERWRRALTLYSVDTQNIEEISDWRKVLRANLFNMVVFSVIIVAIILSSTRYIAPLMAGLGFKPIVTVTVSLAILSPFLWALAFRQTARQASTNVSLNTTQRGPLIVLGACRVALAVFYVGFLLDRLFSPVIALLDLIIACLVIAPFARKIKALYGRIELKFLANLNERELVEQAVSARIPTPWDTHITKFELTARSPYIGRTLAESRVRETFGVNIVVIERSGFVISIPSREQHLYPGDKISVIGTEEQLDTFKTFLESSLVEPRTTDVGQNVSLHHFLIGRDSPLVGQSIHVSRIGRRSRGLVVGIERNGEHIVNPESELVFQENDKVWLVGNDRRIRVILRALEARPA